MSDRKAVIKNADMSEDMQQDAVDCATQAMEKYNIEKDIAAYIKKVHWESRGWWPGVGIGRWTLPKEGWSWGHRKAGISHAKTKQNILRTWKADKLGSDF